MTTTLSSLEKRMDKFEEKVNKIYELLPKPEKPSRFTDNKDGTMTDKETNLVWQKQDDGKRRKWQEAKDYAEKNEAKLPGEGWRLPTVKELFSLVDHSKYNPAIDPLFLGTQSAYYWTSTPCAGDPGYAWCVGFSGGGVDWVNLNFGHLVRPVRQNS